MSVVMTTPSRKDLVRDYNPFGHIRYEHLAAGISGGVASTLSLHPLDVLKIRFAVNDERHGIAPKYDSYFSALKTITREETVRGLYRGVLPNVFGSGLAWGCYFLFYNSIKTWMQDGNVNTNLTADRHLIAAVEAGVCTLCITNPIWIAKTRLILQYSKTEDRDQYKGTIDALVKIWKAEGIRGYYRGFIPGLFGVSHGAIQFVVYEKLKHKYYVYYDQPISNKLNTATYLYCAGISKLIASSVTYPYQVIRARLQNQHYQYQGFLKCIGETWQFEGVKGFYKGLGANMIKVLPSTMITFIVYENVSHCLLNWDSAAGKC